MQENILVVRFGSLGDVILTSSAVLNCKIRFPDSRLTYLTKARYREVVELFDGVDEIVTLPDDAGPVEFLRLLHELEPSGFTHLIDLHGNLRSWWARTLLSAEHKVVYDKRRLQRRNIVRTGYHPHSALHTIDLYNRALKQFGVAPYAQRPVVHPPGSSSDGIKSFVGKEPLVAIAPGAAHPPKRWPRERFIETARLIRKATGASIFWLVTRAEQDSFAQLDGDGNPTARVLVDYPIRALARLLSRCRVTLSNDSGIAHLSSAVGTPTLALFGPTHPALGFSPRGLFDEVIQVDEFCRPCSLHGEKPCYRKEQYCFTRIAPEEVAERAIRIITAGLRTERAILVDRDGTLIENKHYLGDPEQVELITGAAEAVRTAHKAGYKVVVISNQSGIARGILTIEQVEQTNRRLLELLAKEDAEPDAIYYCPHHPEEGQDPTFTRWCRCRKPGGGMAEAAAQALDVDLRRSFIIGDSHDDLNLARVIGAQGVLVRTGHGRTTEEKLQLNNQAQVAGLRRQVRVCNSLLPAVQYVTTESCRDD